MHLPNADHARIDQAKLRDYCLNPGHDKGKHKARLFRSKLGVTADQWMALRNAIVQAIAKEEVQIADADPHGQRYSVDFDMKSAHGSARVRSCWIILNGAPDELLRGRMRTRIVANGIR